MDDLVECGSRRYPQRPDRVAHHPLGDVKQKVTDYLTQASRNRSGLLSAVQGGDFKLHTGEPEFYQAIIDARKAKIG